MPLSEHEQRLLDQIERELYAEDPKFASSVRGNRMRKPAGRRRLQGIALFVVGIAILVVGLIVPLRVADIPLVSVFGFPVMLFGAMMALMAVRRQETEGTEASSRGSSSVSGSAAKRNSLAQRMEERFRRRFNEH